MKYRPIKNALIGMSLLAVMNLGLLGQREIEKNRDLDGLVSCLSKYYSAKKEYSFVNAKPINFNTVAYAETKKNEIKDLEAQISELDKRVDEIDLNNTGLKVYDDFKNLGYIYCKSDKYPLLLKIEKNKGDVYYCRSKTKGFEGYSDKISGFNADKTNDVIVILDSIESEAKELKNFGKIAENNEYFRKNDKRWNPRLQALYNIAKDSENEPETYKMLRIDDVIIHERQHAQDGNKYCRGDKETRAYLKSLMNSPICLSILESHISKQPKNADEIIYKRSAEKIFSGLMSFQNIKEKRDIYMLSEKELGKTAETLLKKWYKD